MKTSEESGEAKDKTKFPWVGLVRLIAAVAGSLVASFFLEEYSRLSYVRYQHEHPDSGIVAFNWDIHALGLWVLIVPIVNLLLGLILLWLRPKSSVGLEIFISAIWLASLLMIVLPIYYWQMNNVPINEHMQWGF